MEKAQVQKVQRVMVAAAPQYKKGRALRNIYAAILSS